MPVLDKICLASLVKCSSDLHCPAVAFGLRVHELPSSACTLGEMSCECPIKGKILKGLAKCSRDLESPDVNFEFSLILLVNTLALRRAPGAGRKSLEKRQALPRRLPCVLLSFLLGILLVKPSCARTGIKGLKRLTGFIQVLCEGLDAMKTRVFAFIRG